MLRAGALAVFCVVVVALVVHQSDDKVKARASDAVVESATELRPITEADIARALPEAVAEIDRQLSEGQVKFVTLSGEESQPESEEDIEALREKFSKMDYDSLKALFDFHAKECDTCLDHEKGICMEAFLVLQEIMRRPEFGKEMEALTSTKAAPPLVDPAQIDALNDRLTEISTKLDSVLARPEPPLQAFPTADAIADRVVEKAVDKIADKVVEKIRGLLLEIKAQDGTVRKEVVKTSSISGSQPFQLNPGEVVTHIDGVPVNQTMATEAVQYGWQSTAPVYQTPSYQVQRGMRGYQVMPRQGTCRMVNGQRVCN